MSLSFDAWLVVAERQIPEWADCPPLSSDDFFIDSLVADAWSRCYWDDELLIPQEVDSRSPGKRFAVLNLWYRIATYKTGILFMLSATEDTVPGLPPDLNGRGYFLHCLRTLVDGLPVEQISDVDWVVWEASTSAALHMWDRFDDLITAWGVLAHRDRAELARLQALSMYCEMWAGPHAEWSRLCHEACIAISAGDVDLAAGDFIDLTVPQELSQPVGVPSIDLKSAVSRYVESVGEPNPVQCSAASVILARAMFVAGTLADDLTLSRRAAHLYRAVARARWHSPRADAFDSIDFGDGDAGVSMRHFLTSQLYAMAVRCAVGADDHALRLAIAREWAQRLPLEHEALAAFADALAASGDSDGAATWAIRAARTTSGKPVDSYAALLSHLATTTARNSFSQALVLCRNGLLPFIEARLRAVHREGWRERVRGLRSSDTEENEDAKRLLETLLGEFNVFQDIIRKVGKRAVEGILRIRNRWAHQQGLTQVEVAAAISAIAQLLRAIGSKAEAERVAALLSPADGAERPGAP